MARAQANLIRSTKDDVAIVPKEFDLNITRSAPLLLVLREFDFQLLAILPTTSKPD
jgi:hypothetical protein